MRWSVISLPPLFLTDIKTDAESYNVEKSLTLREARLDGFAMGRLCETFRAKTLRLWFQLGIID
jgi:hypothetical protein